MPNLRLLLSLVLIAASFAFQSSSTARVYRWVGSDGLIFYSDKVPPSQSKFERNVLNPQGHVVETVQAAKTKEQIALEVRLRLLRKEQEKIIAKQKSNDKVLLSTFRNINDLRLTLDGKLGSIDAQKRVHERTLKDLNDNLNTQRKKAAKAERNAKKVSDRILNKIADIEKQIEQVYIAIGNTLEKRAIIEAKFHADIERFIFLTKSSTVSAEELSDDSAEIAAAATLGLYNCTDRQSCATAWNLAKEFVALNSTTSINFNTKTLIMANDPMNSSDISLSASKSKRDNNRTSIFLDIRCHKSSLGKEMCQSDTVKNIRHSFRTYIEDKLAQPTE